MVVLSGKPAQPVLGIGFRHAWISRIEANDAMVICGGMDDTGELADCTSPGIGQGNYTSNLLSSRKKKRPGVAL